jgi:serine/threonine protein kinase
MFNATNVRRFNRENDILHQLAEHSNIVKPKSRLIDDSGYRIYAMEFLEDSLGHVIYPLPADDINTRITIFTQICEGLRHAHSRGIFHRDLHLNNVRFAGNTTTPKITDFGLGKVTDYRSLSDEQFREWGWFVMPPEVIFQVLDDPTADNFATGDIFALGLLLLDMFTNPSGYVNSVRAEIIKYQLPLGLTDPVAYSQLTTNDKQTHYDEWLKTYDRSIESYLDVQLVDMNRANKITEVITKMCDPDRAKRYQDIDNVLEEIRKV